MPKKATKRGSEAALRQRHSTAKFAPVNGGGAPSDPPIIITGGGSITITSPVQFDEKYDSTTKLYTYYNAEAKGKKLKAKGKAANFDDDCDDGKFEVSLTFDRVPPKK